MNNITLNQVANNKVLRDSLIEQYTSKRKSRPTLNEMAKFLADQGVTTESGTVPCHATVSWLCTKVFMCPPRTNRLTNKARKKRNKELAAAAARLKEQEEIDAAPYTPIVVSREEPNNYPRTGILKILASNSLSNDMKIAAIGALLA